MKNSPRARLHPFTASIVSTAFNMGPVLYYYALNRYIIISIFYDQEDNAHIIPADSLGGCDFARRAHTLDFAPGTSSKALWSSILKIQYTSFVNETVKLKTILKSYI